jgi:DNA-binding NarL/FixJ family response regulator
MLGVRGFFYEQDSLDVFLKGIRAIFDGELWLPRKIMMKCILNNKSREPLPSEDGIPLTQRENEILAIVAVGATNEEIADRLCISSHTVKTHLYNIFRKISVPNRLQAALWAAKNL